MDHTTTQADSPAGPVRTVKAGDWLTIFNGDLEIMAVKGKRVTVRLHPASSQQPPVMFPAKEIRKPP